MFQRLANGEMMLDVRPFSPRDRKFTALADRGRLLDWNAEDRARQVIQSVWDDGDAELHRHATEDHEKASLPIRIAETDITDARKEVSEGFLTALSLARVNARKYHEDQRKQGYINNDIDGSRLLRRIRPLQRVGIVCGHSFLSLLLHAVPAQMAGVGELTATVAAGTGGRIDPRLLATAAVLGIDELYCLDGSHAVAALGLGTQSIRSVDKIVGLESIEEEATGRLLSHIVGIAAGRMAGELVVVADESANARFIAADILAQAELPGAALFALLTDNRLLAEAVRIEAVRMIDSLPNRDRIQRIVEEYGAIFHFPDLGAALEAANRLAPSRLSLQTRMNEECLSEIETAGAIFMGPWSAETVSYGYTGINPFLPTGGRSRFASGLGMDDFVRETSTVEHGPDRLLKTGRHLALLADEENLPGHAMALRERLELLRLTVE